MLASFAALVSPPARFASFGKVAPSSAGTGLAGSASGFRKTGLTGCSGLCGSWALLLLDLAEFALF